MGFFASAMMFHAHKSLKMPNENHGGGGELRVEARELREGKLTALQQSDGRYQDACCLGVMVRSRGRTIHGHFRLEISGRVATVSQICVSDDSFEAISSGLRRELRAMKIANLTLRIPHIEVERWTRVGFQRGSAYVKFSRTPIESNTMPLLPLINATQKYL